MFEEEVKEIVAVVGLNWTPIAGKLSFHNKAFGDSALKLSICEALNLVKRDNVIVCLSKENCVCIGGRHFIGLEIVPIETLAPAVTTQKHKVYESTEAALKSMRKQPQPVKRGDCFILGPLEKFDSDPI